MNKNMVTGWDGDGRLPNQGDGSWRFGCVTDEGDLVGECGGDGRFINRFSKQAFQRING